MEVFDIGINDLEPVSLKIDEPTTSSKPSVNFGPGIELLMNDKKRSSSNAVNIDLGELDKLENELNSLSSSAAASSSETKTLGGLGNTFSNCLFSPVIPLLIWNGLVLSENLLSTSLADASGFSTFVNDPPLKRFDNPKSSLDSNL